MQEIEEGEYMIITSETVMNRDKKEGKKEIILEQLRQIGLEENKDYFVFS
jgi:hypothetical protein